MPFLRERRKHRHLPHQKLYLLVNNPERKTQGRGASFSDQVGYQISSFLSSNCLDWLNPAGWAVPASQVSVHGWNAACLLACCRVLCSERISVVVCEKLDCDPEVSSNAACKMKLCLLIARSDVGEFLNTRSTVPCPGCNYEFVALSFFCQLF